MAFRLVGRVAGDSTLSARLTRRYAPLLLRGVVTVPGVRDLVSGFAAIRLVALRNALRSQADRLLVTDGWAANAELYWRAGRYARRVETVASVERHDLRSRASRAGAGAVAGALWRARRALRDAPVPPPPPETTARRELEAGAAP